MLIILAALAAVLAGVACFLLLGMRNKLGGGEGHSDENLKALSESMRDEFARNRKESAEQAQAQREEQRKRQEDYE